ncbi:MAG: Holliday junction DNA helicase RuvB C-terminal domain-containing protein, partial [Pseudomonadota bacterium]
VGATTRTGLLTTPLRDRFGILSRLDFYNHADLERIIHRGARLLQLDIRPDGAKEIARRSRGTPRIATRLLRRVRDFALVDNADAVTASVANDILIQLSVDSLGLDSLDRRYLDVIASNYSGGPVGIDTLAAALSEQRDTLEETVEPFLLRQGLLQRTPRGRMLTRGAWDHLGLSPPRTEGGQSMLFDNLSE